MIPGAKRSSQPVLNSFIGGLNTSSDPYSLRPDESPNILNVSAGKRRSLRKRNGRTELNASALSQLNGNGALYLRPREGEEKLVAHFGTELFKMDGLDGTFDSIKTGLKNDISEMVSYVAAEGGVLKNFAVIANLSESPLLKWDGIESSADLFNPAAGTPIVKHISTFKGRLYTCGNRDNVQRIDFTDFQSFSFTSGNSFDIVTPEGEGLEGFGLLRSSLYAFKRSSIHRITFLGGVPLHRVDDVSSTNIGCVSAKTIQNITFKGEEVLIFLGSDRTIYLFNGYSPVPISKKIDIRNDLSDFSLEDLNEVAIRDAWSVKDTKNQRVYFFFALGGDANMTHRLIFDYSGEGAYFPDDNMALKSGVFFQTADGDRFQIGLDYAGQAFIMDRGETDDGTTVAPVYQSPILHQDSTTTKKEYYAKFYTRGSSQNQVTFEHRSDFTLGFSSKTQSIEFSNNTNIEPNGSDDYLGTFVLGTDGLGGVEVISRAFDIPKTDGAFDFKITDTATLVPWEIYKVELYNMSLGKGSGLEENIS